MGSEQSTNRSNTHYVYIQRQERERREAQKQVDAAVEKQRQLYEARIKLVEAEAAKAKQVAEAKAAEAQAAQARAAAQAQEIQAQAVHALQAQAAQAQALHAQTAQALQSQANHVLHAQTIHAQTPRASTSQAQVVQPQAVQTRAAPVIPPRPINNNILERNRRPYSVSANELQLNRSCTLTNFYPNLSNTGINFTPNAANTGNQSGEFKNNQFRNQNRDAVNDFVFVNRVTPSAPQRDRSVSRSRGANNHEDDDVRCKTCNNIYGAKIFQCSGGHSSCDNCRQRRASCGKCGNLITDMRNITLEDYVAERRMPCPNADEGCQLHFKNAEVESHLKECPYGSLTCPLHPKYKHCTWRGKVSQLSSHFKDVHPDFNQADVDTEMLLLNICIHQESLHFVTIGNFNFLFFVKIDEQDRKICMAAQLVGTKVSAKKWNYEVHVYNKREPRRKYQYNDLCTSSSIPISDIFNDSKCLNLPLPYALTFFNEGCLAYKFFIKKNNDGYDRSNFGNKGRGGGRGRGRGGAYRNN